MAAPIHRRAITFFHNFLHQTRSVHVRHSKMATSANSPDPITEMETNDNGASSWAAKDHSLLSNRAKKRLKKFERVEKMRKGQKHPKEILDAEVDDPRYGEDFKPQTSYYFENGLRKVYPYFYSFNSYVKGRWMGREILEVFVKEFRSDTPENYRKTIESGLLTVNGKPVPPEFILGENQLLSHTCHRHENPVLDAPIQIVADTDDVLVINKPSSVPCHPCGRYRYNSLPFILGIQYGYWNLRTLHRLDRLTSGILIFPKTAKSSSRMEKQLRDRRVEKEYVCRVVGKFPDGKVDCHESVGVISHKLSLYKVCQDGKVSHTSFWRLSDNGETSVVKCVPHTGRTHQIRLHLQFLGYPIVNDPFYNSVAFGPNRGKGGITQYSEADIADRIMKEHNVGLWVDGENPLFEQKKAEKEAKEKEAALQKSSLSNTKPDSEDSEHHLSGNDAKADSECDEKLSSSEGQIETSKSSKDDSDVSATLLSDKEQQKSVSTDESSDQAGDKTISDSTASCDVNDSNTLTKHQSDSRMTCEGLETHSEKSKQVIADDTDVSLEPPVKRMKSDLGDCSTAVLSETFDTNEGQLEADDKQGGACCHGEETPATSEEQQNETKTQTFEHKGFDESVLQIDVNCDDCRKRFIDPKPSELMLYLHAMKYKGPNWEYETEMPEWAKPDWKNPN